MLKWYSMLTFIVPFDIGVGPRAAATGPPSTTRLPAGLAHTNQHTHSVVADRRRRAFLTASRGGDGTSASDTIKKMTKEEPEDQTATYSQANGRNAKKPNIEVGAPEEVLSST